MFQVWLICLGTEIPLLAALPICLETIYDPIANLSLSMKNDQFENLIDFGVSKFQI